MPELDCVGEVHFSGEIFHGTFVENLAEIDACQIATDFPYRDYLIIRLSHPQAKRFSDNGLTLGPGLYGTTKEEAEKYAVHRAKGYGAIPLVNEVTVDGKFYDFRAKADISENGMVPVEMAEQWLDYFEANESLVRRFVRREEDVSRPLTSYAAHLKDFIERLKSGKRFETQEYQGSHYHPFQWEYSDEMGRDVRFPRGFDLRDLLRTYMTDRYGVEPVYGGLWVRFMQDELGLDGVILNEGGDAKDFSYAPSYVVYNPQTILDQKIKIVTSP